VLPIEPGDSPRVAAENARGGIELEPFMAGAFIGTVEEIASKVDAVLEAGADYVIFYVPGVAKDLDLVARAESVIKRFA
jgi:alkanesulfonate monooxygenase SsuD/methylene tetrahydromethanopterin reductase-like flavin-dependent oxidoreductase (luciferase family)